MNSTEHVPSLQSYALRAYFYKDPRRNTRNVSLPSGPTKTYAMLSSLYRRETQCCVHDDTDGLRFNAIKGLAFADGRVLSVSRRAKVVKVYDPSVEDSVLSESTQLGVDEANAKVTCFCYGGGELTTGSEDRTVRIWDLQTGKKKQSLQLIRSNPKSVRRRRQSLLLTANNKLKVADLRTEKETLNYNPAHDMRIKAAFFGGEQFFIITDTAIQVLDPRNQRVVAQAEPGYRRTLSAATNGRSVYILDGSGGLIETKLGSMRSEALLAHSEDGFYTMSYNPEMSLLMMGTRRGWIIAYDLIGRRVLGLREPYREGVEVSAISSRGQLVASGDGDGNILLQCPNLQLGGNSDGAEDLHHRRSNYHSRMRFKLPANLQGLAQ